VPVPDHDIFESSTTEGLPVAPSMAPGLAAASVEPHATGVGARVALIAAVAMAIAAASGVVAQVLTRLIAFITNLAFYGRLSTAWVSPSENHLGAWVVLVPVAGAIVVGIMARFGSKAIRGHGIPEAMEQVLYNESRIPARLTLLKPISAAVAIGTGGPFGAEGPIIATGGALGSLIGQLLPTTAEERKVLLGAGAAAGMAATFGSPISAVLLAIELLVFEYRPRSLIPITLASVVATCVRTLFVGHGAAFRVPDLPAPPPSALLAYVLFGAIVGLLSVLVTRAVYAIEDGFAKLPIHWMWWPALGAVPVGIIGYFAPRTLGVGYDNIERIVSGDMAARQVAFLCVLKFVSWSVSLGSGTSGGTLAPLFTFGGGLGALLGLAASTVLPNLGVDARMSAVVGMAAMFAGASRAMLASVVFAFETTQRTSALVPLLGGGGAAFLVSCLFMKNSIMTEKMARRGVPVVSEYAVDCLEQILAKTACSRPVVTLCANQQLGDVRLWLASGAAGSQHQGFPVLGDKGELVGVLTRRDLFDESRSPTLSLADVVRRPAVFVREHATLRQVADAMVDEMIGRIPVVNDDLPPRPVGIISRSDLLSAQRQRRLGQRLTERTFGVGNSKRVSP
jgi:H+/Cl- antiporter ClcA